MNQHYDYIVVGGGSAGCILAARLAEEISPCNVLLIESGDPAQKNPETMTADGFKDAFASDHTMWDRMSKPQSQAGGRPLYMGSGTGMGGSGSVNGMVYTRGDKLDFAQWPKGWKWNKVAPAFKAIEERLQPQPRAGTRFTELCINAAAKVGFARKDGLNDGSLCGFIGYNDMNYQGDRRHSSYVRFIHDRTDKLGQLTVKANTSVQRILFNENKEAIGVEIVDKGLLKRVYASKEIILCAGALETPKLLMLSGVGPKDELQKHHIPTVAIAPGIGKNLHDHPNVCLFYKGKHRVDFGYPQLYGFHRANPALDLPENQADTCYVMFSAPSTLKQSMKRMAPILALPGKLYDILLLRKALRNIIELAFKIPLLEKFVGEIYGIVVILGKPKSKGELRLASRNPQDQAIINPAYYTDPIDMDTMIKGVQLAQKIAAQTELSEWGNKGMVAGAKSTDPQIIKQFIAGATMTTFHYSGSCQMGEQKDAPVDLELNVKGVKKLRVADASVIPEVPVSAINAPSMMIAYRAADFILQSLSNTKKEPKAAAKKTKLTQVNV